MKKLIVRSAAVLGLTTLLTGCIAAIGNGTPHNQTSTVGQQMIDLQKAKDAGAITESEYQTEKAKVLGKKKSEG